MTIISSRFDNDSLYHLIILNIRFLFSINAVNPKSISETLQNSNNHATANQWWVNHGHINSDESITFAAARFVRKVYPDHPSYIETYCPWVDKKRVLLLLGQYTFMVAMKKETIRIATTSEQFPCFSNIF